MGGGTNFAFSVPSFKSLSVHIHTHTHTQLTRDVLKTLFDEGCASERCCCCKRKRSLWCTVTHGEKTECMRCTCGGRTSGCLALRLRRRGMCNYIHKVLTAIHHHNGTRSANTQVTLIHRRVWPRIPSGLPSWKKDRTTTHKDRHTRTHAHSSTISNNCSIQGPD